MAGNGASMLRRFFPSRAITTSYSPDPDCRVRPRNESSTGGEWCVLKMQKQVPLAFHLPILLVKLYAVGNSEVQGSFLAKILSQHAVWMRSVEIDALFRIKTTTIWKRNGARTQVRAVVLYICLGNHYGNLC